MERNDGDYHQQQEIMIAFMLQHHCRPCHCWPTFQNDIQLTSDAIGFMRLCLSAVLLLLPRKSSNWEMGQASKHQMCMSLLLDKYKL